MSLGYFEIICCPISTKSDPYLSILPYYGEEGQTDTWMLPNRYLGNIGRVVVHFLVLLFRTPHVERLSNSFLFPDLFFPYHRRARLIDSSSSQERERERERLKLPFQQRRRRERETHTQHQNRENWPLSLFTLALNLL